MSQSPHLDLDALADHLAGEADASAHLAACSGCTARLAELEAADQMVVAALATLPAPPLPDDVAARLSAALAAERPVDAAATPALTAGATVTPLRRPRRTWLPAAAAGVVLFAGGAIGLSLLGDRGGSDDAATAGGATALSAPEAAVAAGFPTVSSGVDYADGPALTAGLASVLDGTADPQGLRSTAEDSAAAESGPAADAGDPLARLRTPEGLADCLAALLPPEQPDVRPLAVDYATYAGQPALAVVLPDPDPAKVSVFVVGAGCTQAADGTLFFTRLDRP